MGALILFRAVILVLAAWNPGSNWQETVTDRPPGNFAAPAPVVLKYSFSWSKIEAGQAKVRFSSHRTGYTATAEGTSVGMARSLWLFDVRHTAKTDPESLRPISFEQTETVRTKKTNFQATFEPNFVEASKTEKSGAKSKDSKRKFRFPGTRDLLSTYLYLRSLPWSEGDEATIVLFPVFTPYLLHVEAIGRERIKTATGEHDTIKFKLDVKKIAKKKSLESFKRFKSATVWISDDADRFVLKVETELYIGTVRAELMEVTRPEQ